MHNDGEYLYFFNMQEQPQLLSQEKYDALIIELEDRKSTTRNIILERLAFAKSLGDLSENAEYHSAKDEQGKNEARISEIEFIIKNAAIVQLSFDGTIAVGSQVELIRNDNGETKNYSIVGPQEADVFVGKISMESPLGSVLLGKQVGAVVTTTSPRGDIEYTIQSIS